MINEIANINPRSDLELKEGMIFSIDPGIYLQDKLGMRKEKAVVL